MKFTKRAGGEGGMSLVELLIAIVILSVGLVGVLNALPVIYKAAARAQSMTVSSLLADECMAKLKSAPAWAPTTTTYAAFDPPFSEFSWMQEITTTAVASSSGSTMLRRVEITVKYPMMGNDRTLIFHTYVANYSTM